MGKPRRALVAFLLTFLVQPVFWPLYLLLTFRPLDKQHGRFHPMAWWIGAALPYVGLLAGTTYNWIGLVRLQRSRRARGLKSGIGPFWFLVVNLAGPLAAIGYALHYAYSYTGIARRASWEAFFADPLALSIATLLFLLTPAIAVALTVASANGLWRMVYDEKGEMWPWRSSAPAAAA